MAHRLQDIAAKAAGKVKVLRAVLGGHAGVFVTLAKQHSEVLVLLSRAERAVEPSQRAELWRAIRRQLLAHERSELQVLFSELKDIAETRGVAEQHEAQAGDLEALVFRIDGIDVASTAWIDEVSYLASYLRQHVEKEEHDYFTKAQQALGKPRSEALDPIFQSTHAALRQELESARREQQP
jgi:hypothetical protein